MSHFGVAAVWLGPLAFLVAIESLFVYKNARFYAVFVLIGLLLGYFRTAAMIHESENNIHTLQRVTNNFLSETKIIGTVTALSKTDDVKKTFVVHTKTIGATPTDFSLLLEVPTNSFIKE